MPDEVERSSGDSAPRRALDLIDGLYRFQLAYGRKPRSWRDYVYGLGTLARVRAHENLQHAGAVRVGMNANRDQWDQWAGAHEKIL